MYITISANLSVCRQSFESPLIEIIILIMTHMRDKCENKKEKRKEKEGREVRGEGIDGRK